MSTLDDVATAVFDEVESSFPDLRARKDRFETGEPEVTFPVQPGLLFEVTLYLSGDTMNVTIDEFWGEWFPCSDSKVISLYHEAVCGLLSGRFRIVQHLRRGRVLKSLLQRPSESGWETISRHYRGMYPPWIRREKRVLQNVAA